jgi:hypothetical protein
MRAFPFVVAAFALGITAASSAGNYGSPTSTCPFAPTSSQFVLFSDNVQIVSEVNPDQSFLRSESQYVLTPGDLATASSFTLPSFVEGADCSLKLVVPTPAQTNGDLSQVIFSGGGKSVEHTSEHSRCGYRLTHLLPYQSQLLLIRQQSAQL